LQVIDFSGDTSTVKIRMYSVRFIIVGEDGFVDIEWMFCGTQLPNNGAESSQSLVLGTAK